ncbi:SEL1-like repeat protein [Amphritea pacifica]|uniref:SEL1-like repeat protein n=1 Tax=Amphritea pacifica TaxID=2811233 RepID=A0ABS2WB92_9GAMM|nr:SEL1-like repeat protein [Amphritea pacifica]MBN0988901.1 SEL1-like repeat protein [Amphritea pacifica]
MARTVFYLLSVSLIWSSLTQAEDLSCRTLYENKQTRAALQRCLPQAAKGDGEASFILSNLYSQGFEGSPPDLHLALQWLTRSAEWGYGPGCYNLAKLYERGDVVPKSLETAFSWYLKGAKQGHLASQVKTGISYLKGSGTPQDFTQAHHWLELAVEKGDLSAQITLATLLKQTDPQQAMTLYQRAAEQGSGFAHYQLALLYREPADAEEMDLDKALHHAKESERLNYEAAVDLVESLRQQMALEESRRIAEQTQAESEAGNTQLTTAAPATTSEQVPVAEDDQNAVVSADISADNSSMVDQTDTEMESRRIAEQTQAESEAGNTQLTTAAPATTSEQVPVAEDDQNTVVSADISVDNSSMVDQTDTEMESRRIAEQTQKDSDAGNNQLTTAAPATTSEQVPVAEDDQNTSVNADVSAADLADVETDHQAAIGRHDFSWLKSQPEGHYVLQLVQLSSENSVRVFLKKNQLDGKANYFRAVTAAGNMYVVLYAESSASLSGARAIAAGNLPEKLSDRVWYRTYRAILSAYKPVD